MFGGGASIFQSLLGRGSGLGRVLSKARGAPPYIAQNLPWRRALGSASRHQYTGILQALARRTATATKPRVGPSTRSFQTSPFRRSSHTPKPRPSQQAGGGEQQVKETLSISERLKKLSREYGWSAIGVYLGLSVLDFPFCFLLVRVVGTEKIGEIEHSMISTAKNLIPESVQMRWKAYRSALRESEMKATGSNEMEQNVKVSGWGVKEADERHKAGASLATQLALAYAIHKSFIFVRVPLTAAMTPKVVKVLRSWGWQTSKKVTKS